MVRLTDVVIVWSHGGFSARQDFRTAPYNNYQNSVSIWRLETLFMLVLCVRGHSMTVVHV